MANILIVDEVRLNASVMAAVLSDEPDLNIVEMVAAEEDVFAHLAESDIVLISNSRADGGVLRMVERIREKDDEVSILVLGLSGGPRIILDFIEAGASGYVLREESVDELLNHIRAAKKGRAHVSPKIAAMLMARISELADLAEETGLDLTQPLDLTRRERQVLGLVAEGLTNQEIGDKLFIEVGTVKNHVHNILNKLNVRSREEAAAYLNAVEKRGF